MSPTKSVKENIVRKLFQKLPLVLVVVSILLSACSPASVAPAPAGDVDSNSPVIPSGSNNQPAGVYVYADLKPYFGDPIVSACIDAIAYSSMTYEERGAYCVVRYLKPKAEKMSVAKLTQTVGLASVYAISNSTWQTAQPEAWAMPSMSWLGPSLIAAGYAFGVGTTFAYIATSDTYAAKVASWEMNQLTPETEVYVLGYEGVMMTQLELTGEIPTIASWETAEAEWAKLYSMANTIPLANTAAIGSAQRTIKGPLGTEFTMTYLGLSSMCFMNLFTNLMWWDGNNWQHQMFESNINRTDGPCQPKDFVDIFRMLYDKIRAFADKFSTEVWFSSNAWKVTEDLLYFSMRMLVTILKGMIP